MNENHVAKRISLNDSVKGTDSVSITRELSLDDAGKGTDSVSIIKIDPRIKLREVLDQKRWFEGVVLSATYFEHYGLEKLKIHFNGVIDEKRIDLSRYYF
ncbi:MAG: hypothetical protein ABSB71_12275 [Candidatus Bathyarchaeia archaeon]|jgi:hypothetical protein